MYDSNFVDEKFDELLEVQEEKQGKWLHSDSIGDEEGKKRAHDEFAEEVYKWDAFTGGTSTYDEATGKWTFSKYQEPKRGEDGLRRREFSYDVNKDPLYKQYLAQYKRNGEAVMTDTLAKSAAMTGGMVSSYGVSAAAGAYNDYMQGANDIIPELHQLAYDKFQDELSRDREIYQLNEAKRRETAVVNSILQKYQSEGAPLTQEERASLYALDYYIEPDGTIVAPSGDRILAGDGYKDEQMDNALTSYMLGNALSVPDINVLVDGGYIFENGILYGPDGQKVERSYMTQSDEMPAEMTAIYNALAKVNFDAKKLPAKYSDVLAENGFIYDKASNSYIHLTTGIPFLDFFDGAGVTPGTVTEDEEEETPTGGELTEEEKETVDGYVTSFYRPTPMPHLRDGGFYYDVSLSKEENASLYVNLLDVSEALKEAIFEAIIGGK